jgi:hypothetical protein
MRFLRWHPLLTSDNDFQPDPSWQAQGLFGNKLRGYRGMPEFTFACPNHPAMQESVLRHIGNMIGSGMYQGFFLDRIRFPSPSTNPFRMLSCFCEHCRRKAADAGLDLESIRLGLIAAAEVDEGRCSIVKALLTNKTNRDLTSQELSLGEFLDFRKKSILDLLVSVTSVCRNANLEVGLDCFSPSLALMVGQDIRKMSGHADWVKVMTYAHALGPAGLPYELSCFLGYLKRYTRLSEIQSLDFLSQSVGLPLPNNQSALMQAGLSPLALMQEVRRGVQASITPLLAGMELVELENVSRLTADQIKADLQGIRQASPAGLAISWDLLHIPLDRLELVR